MGRKRVAGTRLTRDDVRCFYVLAAIFAIAGTILATMATLASFNTPILNVLTLFTWSGILFIQATILALVSAGMSIKIKREQRRNQQFISRP
jgi:uncharacterized membrane protein YbhN (UPF0104 family)